MEKHAGKIAGACAALEHYCNNFDVRKFAVCTTPGRKPGEQTEYYILYGWMSADDARKLEKETAEDSKIHVMEEDVEEHMSVSPPTKLKNPALFKPFEMFVEMYGLQHTRRWINHIYCAYLHADVRDHVRGCRARTVPCDRRICFLPDQAHEPWSDFIVSRHLVYGIRFYVWQRVWIRGYLKARVDASDG